MAQPGMQKNTLYVGGLAEEVNEGILHAALIPFGEIKDVKTPLDQATQKHRSFGFVTFLEREDTAAAMDNMDGAELYGRVLTVNYALPEKIKGGEQGWAAQPIWADADTWFERQQMEEEMQRLQAEHKASIEAAEELHRKKLAELQGEKEDDPMARAEAEFGRMLIHGLDSRWKEEMQHLQAEQKASIEAAVELHRKKLAEEQGGKEDDPMARAEAEVLQQNRSS